MGRPHRTRKRVPAAATMSERKAVTPPPPISNQWRIAIVSTAAAAFICKILLALRTYGTNDMYAWERFFLGGRYLGVSIYRAAWDFNHPPFIIHMLAALGWLERTIGLPFAFWLRLMAGLADLGGLWLVWKILGPRVNEPSIARALLFLAAAPSLIMISGFHGNTDPIMIFFILLSVWLATEEHTLLAGAAFGMAISIKIVPLILIPVMFFYFPGIRRRIQFFASMGAVMLAAWSPFLFQDTRYLLGQIFRYQSLYGHWGVSFLLSRLAEAVPDLQGLNDAFRQFGTYVAFALIIAQSWWMNRSGNKPSLFAQVGLVFSLFLALSTGFGVQYLAWLAPWVVELGAAPAAIFYASSGAFLFLVYTYWAQGLPWYLADSNGLGDWNGYIHLFQVLCWLSVVMAAAIAWKRIQALKTDKAMSPWPLPALGWRIAACLPLAALLVYAAAQQVTLQSTGSAQRLRLSKVTTEEIHRQLYMWLCSQGLGMMKPQQTIIAAKEELSVHPQTAGAYTLLAVAYERLQLWDQALASAREALLIDPGFEYAGNVLREARQHQLASGPVMGR